MQQPNFSDCCIVLRPILIGRTSFFVQIVFISFESSSYLLLCEAVAVKWGNSIYWMQLGLLHGEIYVSDVSLKGHPDL